MILLLNGGLEITNTKFRAARGTEIPGLRTREKKVPRSAGNQEPKALGLWTRENQVPHCARSKDFRLSNLKFNQNSRFSDSKVIQDSRPSAS